MPGQNHISQQHMQTWRARRGNCASLPYWRAALMVAFFAALAITTFPASARGPASVADIAAPLQAAVVNISTTQKLPDANKVPTPQAPQGSPFEDLFNDFLGPNDDARRISSLGSGFVLDPSGLIVTNNHVIEDADEILITFTNGETLKVAKIIGRDSKTDLALLRVEPKKPLAAVKFGDSSKMRVGDWVMAIGNPFGLGGTVTVGVISATRRDINAGPYDDFIQTDAAINRGNSGGPLFNMKGEVIGINTAIISPTGGSIGIGFALPSNTAGHVIEQLRKFGETRRGWIGVRIQTVNGDIAESLGMVSPSGALVASVTPEGPAARAGVQLGDVILEFNGQKIATMRQLPSLVADSAIGKPVSMVVLRRGKKKALMITVDRLEESSSGQTGTPTEPPSSAPNTPHKMLLGLSLVPLSDELRARFKIDPEVKGMVVTAVEAGSRAQERHIKPGDVVVEITNRPVASTADVEERINELRRLKRKTALLLLADREGEMNFIALPLK